MTRRIVRKVQSHSAAALFLRTLMHVPTPWCTTSWVEDGSPKQVKFRLWVRRRGRTLHVETHADSPDYAGLAIPVKLQRQGLYLLHEAGMKLVRLSKLDPTAAPAQPRYMWNKSHADFLEGKHLLHTVASHLYHLLNPKRGRPRRPPVVGDATMPGAPVGMKMQRRKELMDALQRVLNTLDPVLDRVHDARKMRGYTVDQRNEIAMRMDHLYRDARVLRSAVFDDQFTSTMAEVRKQSTEQILGIAPRESEKSDSHTPVAAEPFSFDTTALDQLIPTTPAPVADTPARDAFTIDPALIEALEHEPPSQPA